jgi:hypothetical protein
MKIYSQKQWISKKKVKNETNGILLSLQLIIPTNDTIIIKDESQLDPIK